MWRLLVLLILFASAPAAAASPRSPNPSKGLVVLAVRLPPGHLARYYVNIARIDPANGNKVLDDVDMGDGWVTNFSGTFERFEIEEVDPGEYQIINVNHDSGRNHFVVCFSNVPSRFTVRAGEAIFLGEFALRPFSYQTGDLAKAQTALAEKYAVGDRALVQAELMVAPPISHDECR